VGEEELLARLARAGLLAVPAVEVPLKGLMAVMLIPMAQQEQGEVVGRAEEVLKEFQVEGV
jgi:hypothetical protein